MGQLLCLGNSGPTLCQCLVRKAEAEKDDRQMRLCYQLRVGSRLMYEELGLAFCDFWGKVFERVGDLRTQLLPGLAQQVAVRRVLY